MNVIVEIKNGASAGFTANQIFTGLAEGSSITGVVKGLGGGFALPAGTTLENVASFVIRYF